MKSMHVCLVMLTAMVLGSGILFAADASAWQDCYDRLSPEKQVKYNEILKGYHEKVSPLIEKMMAGRLELQALAGNSNADPKRITALAEEVAALKMQLNRERWTLRERLQGEVGIADSSLRDMREHGGRPRMSGEEPGRACDGPGYLSSNEGWREHRYGMMGRPGRDCGEGRRASGNCQRTF